MRKESEKIEFKRTLDVKPNEVSIIKPGELVDVVEMSPLTLADRRIFNLLLANAWDDIDQPGREHRIAKRDLQFTEHKGTARIGPSINRLMATVVHVRHCLNGEWETERVHLLGRNNEPDASDGFFRYRFDDRMREIIKESTVFARLHRQIMLSLSSKYSLALYEMIQKRGNMNRTAEVLTLEEFRGLLGVPPKKLVSWINLRNKALDPAMKEVSALSDFDVSYDPIRGTKKGETSRIVALKLQWKRKSEDGLQRVQRELNFSKVGRRARIDGTVEDIHVSASFALREDTLQKARSMFKGYDIYFLEAEWKRAFESSPAPGKPDGAFINWAKKYVERNPLPN